MRKKIKPRYLVVLLIFVIIISYLFWGPLFPWNPVKLGYKKIKSSKAVIYINEMTERDSVVYLIDELILEEEKFHDLKYVADFKIIILDKDSNMKRYVPWLKGAGFSVSLSLANLIYIGPTARKSPSGIEPYLKHELSHLLIDQNTSFKKTLKIHEQGWFIEGIAEYFSGHSFYSKSEFLEICKMNNLHFTSLYKKNPLKMSLKEVRFKYTFYRFFIEFVVENYGLKKLQEYLKKYIKNPGDYKELFVEVYSNDLTKLLDKFNTSLNRRKTP
jgi:hypothetical protein